MKNNVLIKDRKFWSVYDRIKFDIPTTTNSCEAYHVHLNRNTQRKSEPLLKTINLLQNEEERIKHKINNMKFGNFYFKKRTNKWKVIVDNFEFYDNLEFYEALSRIFELSIK
ncbi:hypothetical protein DMUE_1085 [Dictyocoela muelleri]|nr:hypothetical protein DMUE_1085 [Dictyocoela muelleri]